ncbi:ABC transporter permease [Polynucleobacter sp.]|jgi:glycine betaine/proline transport system permease protein|uniref:ABC transporter permease n=1 Tax=Polynucleobacter sp. TaxID=2029855 RepID=UPI0037CC8860
MTVNIFIPMEFSSSLNEWINSLVETHGDFLHAISAGLLKNLLVPLEQLLTGAPPSLVILLVGVIAFIGSRNWLHSAGFMAAIYFIGCLGLWEKTMQTLALMSASLIVTVIIGIPIGILMASHRQISKVVTPILDVMQTFPLFVYMLPAVMLFSIGKVPAVMATVIYSIPPLIRLTELGIREVNHEIQEAAKSFGASYWQLLRWVSLPLARPAIMTGINQATMMALAMTVVASMIGANGLGEDILGGLTNLDFGKGAAAGVAVVILAVVIDRITQLYGRSARAKSARLVNCKRGEK